MDIISLKDFFAMGGYAFYVWTAYGIVIAVLAINVIVPVVRRRRLIRTLRRKADECSP